jgi:hypothetical protein
VTSLRRVTSLNRRLVEALAPVRVDLAALTAHVGDHELRAGSPDELRRLLSAALYDRLHAGRGEGRPDAPQDLTDTDFEARLRTAVPHGHTRVAASVGATDGDTVVVTLDGVRVRLPASGAEALAVGQHVLQVDCLRPRLSPGFLLVDGSGGYGLDGGPVLRVYVNIATAEAAPEVFGVTLRALERLAVPYRAKITSVRAGLPRRDGAVVYLGRRSWHAATVVAAAVQHVEGRGEAVSPYTERLGPGVSAAWEPTDGRLGYRGLSFGEHRSLVISTALLEHAKNPATSPEIAVANEFGVAGIDPRAPFRDVTSPDLTDILQAASAHGGKQRIDDPHNHQPTI